MTENDGADFIELTADIVSAYVSNNSVPASDLPALISEVHSALSRVIGGAAPVVRCADCAAVLDRGACRGNSLRVCAKRSAQTAATSMMLKCACRRTAPRPALLATGNVAAPHSPPATPLEREDGCAGGHAGWLPGLPNQLI